MVTLAAQPGGEEWTAVVPARASATRLGVDAEGFKATPTSLDVDLGPGLSARFNAPREWPRRATGPLGIGGWVPWLGQYWAPWLLGAEVTGSFGERSLDGALVYAEKNWGAAFAGHGWWGQASFGPNTGVAFAGGRIHGVAPTAVCAWTPAGVVSLAPPLARTRARAGGGEWHIRARSPRWEIELAGEATEPPLLLSVPLPGRERRLEQRSRHHLRGRLAVTVRRGRRLWLREQTTLAGLEDGS
jgi:hypothetical protein